MNIQQLRQSLKLKWVSYYYNNRSWLEKMRVWGTYDGERRPNSGFILATLSVLEPQFEQMLPFISELNNNPDQIVVALGLNFNPEEHLHLVESPHSVAESEVNCEPALQLLPHQSVTPSVITVGQENNSTAVSSVAIQTKETCEVPFQRLTDCKPLIFGAIASEVTGESQFVQSVAVTSAQMESNFMPLMSVTSTPMKSKSQFTPVTLPDLTKVEPKSQSVPSVSFTACMGHQNKPSSLLAVTTADRESKSRLVSSGAICAKHSSVCAAPPKGLAIAVCEVESKAVSSVSLATKMESKGRLVTTPPKDAHNQVNPPPAGTSRLANWIDDFCQGIEWDREDTRFIP
ncbi:DUF5331 domain-containing protein [Brasilonema sp. UFV-L1]|uniref:DUF5331 domain-containing protein n=1 Tax=Brasilonema sp. UFV-L1 TaxID=2234130 RepID=UPI00145EC177|nr:DUF5331 domain-containing protein [Brasilonema sp. UFV-L1]